MRWFHILNVFLFSFFIFFFFGLSVIRNSCSCDRTITTIAYLWTSEKRTVSVDDAMVQSAGRHGVVVEKDDGAYLFILGTKIPLCCVLAGVDRYTHTRTHTQWCCSYFRCRHVYGLDEAIRQKFSFWCVIKRVSSNDTRMGLCWSGIEMTWVALDNSWVEVHLVQVILFEYLFSVYILYRMHMRQRLRTHTMSEPK